MKLIEVECSNCHCQFDKPAKYVRYNQEHGFRNYCSQKCSGEANTTAKEVSCANCGEPITRTLSALKRSASGDAFCSRSCSNSVNNSRHKSGTNHPNYNVGSGSYRKKMLSTEVIMCVVCGYDIVECLEVHHQDGNRKNNEDDNLVWLCPTHHTEVHKGLRHLI
jgi:hypothetical protein